MSETVSFPVIVELLIRTTSVVVAFESSFDSAEVLLELSNVSFDAAAIVVVFSFVSGNSVVFGDAVVVVVVVAATKAVQLNTVGKLKKQKMPHVVKSLMIAVCDSVTHP